MNSHLLLEVVNIIVNQQEQIETLKERITKLEQVGEMAMSNPVILEMKELVTHLTCKKSLRCRL